MAQKDLVDNRIEELKKARVVFAQTLVLNLVVALSKMIWGFLSGTLSMLADGFHSLLDTASNVVGIIGLTISMKPADENHPYGHRKFEALAAMGISGLMFLASFQIMTEAFERLTSSKHAQPEVTVLSYVIMFSTIGVNMFVSWYERRRARELRSGLLMADSQHTLSDMYTSWAVVASLVAIQMQMPIIDIVASIIIIGFILRAGFLIVMSEMGSLVDEAKLDPVQVEQLVLEVPGVRSCHKIRSRGMQDHIFLDLHVQVDKNMTMENAHEISFQVEKNIKSKVRGVVDVLVHLEDDNPPVAEMKGEDHTRGDEQAAET
jgi:cation diffusion facilitator family transporter